MLNKQHKMKKNVHFLTDSIFKHRDGTYGNDTDYNTVGPGFDSS